MSAEETDHSAKIKAGQELARQHKAGAHADQFVKECARCKAEAKERRKAPAPVPVPDRTGEVSSAVFSEPVPQPQAVGDPASAAYVPPPEKADDTPPDKTPEQRDREHRDAMRAAAEAEREARQPIPPVAGKPGTRGGDVDGELVFHVLHDGFTVLGAVWYRGQEIGIKNGSAYDQLSRDIAGHAWYEMTPETQMDRFGRVMFAVGPWPYSDPTEVMTDDDYAKALNSNDLGAVRRYEKEQQRQTKPPVPLTR